MRVEYRRLLGWVLIALRYYIAIVMSIYGGFKVIDSQFPPITFEQLSQPLGALPPMGLLWVFMGHSTVYAMFVGAGESVGAFLLFFRRTTTAGALLLVAVLSNVVLLNYTFDVSVKEFSTGLLLATIVLVASDARRIVAFLFNSAATPSDRSFNFRSEWIIKSRRVLKPVVVVLATIGPVSASAYLRYGVQVRPPFFGVYDVREFRRNGRAVPTSDGARWRRFLVDRGPTASVRFVADSMVGFSFSVDSAHRRFHFRERTKKANEASMEYEILADSGLRLRGVVIPDTIDVTLLRVRPERVFRLLR